jgi:hypothetical protein
VTDELAHHLRQAEADLGLARTSVGMALTCAKNGEGVTLRLVSSALELMEVQMRAMRQLRDLPVGQIPLRDPPPGSSER